jgi:hypothetical protein
MSIWNKILIGFICVGSLGFFYLAMRTLKTQEHWRNYAYACEYFLEKDKEISAAFSEGGQLPQTLDDNDAVRKLREFYKKNNYTGFSVSGETKWPDFKKAVLETVSKTGKLDRELLAACTFKTEETPGIEHFRVLLKKATLNRARVWDNFMPQSDVDDSGQVKVSDGQADPQGITAKMLVYVFDRKKDEGDKGVEYLTYLGEFSVESVGEEPKLNVAGDKQAVIQLKATKELTPREIASIKDSRTDCTANKRAWVIYERMPLDGNDVFAGREDEDKKKLLPPDSVNEYLKDGQPATWEQMEEWGVKGILVDEAGRPLVDDKGEKKAGEKGFYRRQLRDYQALFDWYDEQRIVMHDLLASIKHNDEQALAAATNAQQQVALRKQEVAALTAQSNQLQTERKLIVAHFAAVRQKIDEFLNGWKKPDGSRQKGLVELLKENEELAKDIGRKQFEAVRRIDERTRTMASSGETR